MSNNTRAFLDMFPCVLSSSVISGISLGLAACISLVCSKDISRSWVLNNCSYTYSYMMHAACIQLFMYVYIATYKIAVSLILLLHAVI